jgi:hypothetical protein
MSERYRYTGPDASRLLALPGGFIEFPRMRWVDPHKACEDALIPVHHLEVVLPGLGEEFEREGPVKAARTRRKHAEEATGPAAEEEAPEATETGEEPTEPAEPDEEQS